MYKSVIEPVAFYPPEKAKNISIRRIPYPYNAMLAICSDLDETPNRHIYFETMRYLNTTEDTNIGKGLGLEVGNTIYFDMPQHQFSYWNTDDKGRAMIRTLIQSGHIDCLHSYGDLATSRAHAGRALDELSRYNCCLAVWIDHGIAPSNFGKDIMCGLGDVLGSEVYHADLTCDFGVQYVWRGRVTSVIGQDVPRSLRRIWNYRYPLASTKTLLKEFTKGIIADLGNEKYSMHGSNQIIKKSQLRSGQKVFEFIRSNPHWGGVSCGTTVDGLAEALTESMLEYLVNRQGICILYTHLGKVKRQNEPFGQRARQALNLLARYFREGKILVTTTRRLLGYCRAVREIAITTSISSGFRVDLNYKGSKEDLRGLTLYVSNPAKVWITVNGREIKDLKYNGPDHTGQESISLPWMPLEFPSL